MLAIATKVTGLREIELAFDRLGSSMRRKINRKAVTAGIRVLTTAGKANVPKATGTTAKALGQVVRSYKGGRNFLAVFGARQGQAREVARSFTKRGKQRIKLTRSTERNVAGKREVRDAFRTIHLTESGRRGFVSTKPLPLRTAAGQTVFRRRVRPAAGSGFLAKTARQAMPAALAAAQAELRTGVDQAMRGAAAA